jgi:hypothetical protein
LLPNADGKSAIGNRQSEMSLGLFVISVFATTATELTKLKPVRRGLFILGRYVVAALTLATLKNNIVAWHNLFPISLISNCRLPISNWRFVSAIN